VKLRLTDQYRQQWTAEIFRQTKCINYRMYKDSLDLENYLLVLPPKFRRLMIRFRCRNHRLPVEANVYRTDIDTDKCTLCDTQEVGDEFHYLFKCPSFAIDRQLYIKKIYWNNPSAVKFSSVMNCKKRNELINLCKFISIILDKF
jgi:hypothetical protein